MTTNIFSLVLSDRIDSLKAQALEASQDDINRIKREIKQLYLEFGLEIDPSAQRGILKIEAILSERC